SLQGHVPMCETRRQPQLLPVGGGKLNCDVAAVTRGSLAEVDADIQYRSPDATHQLALGVRGDLEMQPSQHAPLRRINVVLLHELLVQPCRRQSVPTIGLGKKAPVIGALGRDHRENIRNIKPFDLHLGHFRVGASYRFRRRSCRCFGTDSRCRPAVRRRSGPPQPEITCSPRGYSPPRLQICHQNLWVNWWTARKTASESGPINTRML